MTTRGIRRFAAGAALVLLAWTAILAGLAFAVPPGTPLAVFAPGHAMEAVAEAEGSFEGFGHSIAVTRSSEEGFARRLYGAGAFLVIDARVVMSCRTLYAGVRSGAKAS
ncbi:hypothetical protein [Taklimakanibacter lacteus]|uniref:hypothetical protein n=1 Tax=Taklimakanibacter lacteus TaxID=2268456 RepID=UPI000E663008